MNRTTIDWADFTWNPVYGCHGTCGYCYARRMAHRFHRDFTPHLVETAFPPKLPTQRSTIFVCSMADLFHDQIPTEWVFKVLWALQGAKHRIVFLTKNPIGYLRYVSSLSPHWILGTTIDGTEESRTVFNDWLVLANNPRIKNRLMLSFEPLLGDVATEGMFDHAEVAARTCWFIIGGQTPCPRHHYDWVHSIIRFALLNNINVFTKANLHYDHELHQVPVKEYGE